MFELSFYTILMAFLTSTVLFSLSCIFFSSSKRILNVGYKTIAFISFHFFLFYVWLCRLTLTLQQSFQ